MEEHKTGNASGNVSWNASEYTSGNTSRNLLGNASPNTSRNVSGNISGSISRNDLRKACGTASGNILANTSDMSCKIFSVFNFLYFVPYSLFTIQSLKNYFALLMPLRPNKFWYKIENKSDRKLKCKLYYLA